VCDGHPGNSEGIEPEKLLCAAFLRQIANDLQSEVGFLRSEARQFLEDERALEFWCSMAGLETETVRMRLERCTRA
jgi:hypothetical protein